MKKYNVIAVFNEDADRVLMCKRRKDPYKGLSNFVGGKIEENESGIDAAYRELAEETGICSDDITLAHLMDFTYYSANMLLEVYVGKINKEVTVTGEENELYWSKLDHNFFDSSEFAGDGNIGHIINCIEKFKKDLLN